MKKFGWMLALAMTTVIVSCHKEISPNEQTVNSNNLQTEIATQAAGTSATCNAPGGLYVSNIATPTATLNWSAVAGAAFYNVQWKSASSSTWLNAASATYGTSVNLYSLSANTTYDWRVMTYCSLTEGSAFTTAQFSTSGSTPPPVSACPGPNDVSTNGTMSGAATIDLNIAVNGTIAPANDIDYYKFTMNWYGGIAVYLTNLPANYDLAVFNSSGVQIGISQNKGSKSETVSLTVDAGDYYVKVYPKGTANSATSCYTLKVQTI
jgi:hypothetical protein